MQYFLLIALLAMGFVVYSESACCGRGTHGFCKDCSIVNSVFSSGQKCCGSGSGNGNGCNIFCCNCDSCRTGNPVISFVSGWLWSKKYSCKQSTVSGDNNLKEISETKVAFKALDKDEDNTLNHNEFLEGLRNNLNMDFESSYSMAADLLNDDDGERALDLLDVAQNDKELNVGEALDILHVARAEFDKMDSNKDGIIQASEFDKDLV